MKKMHFFSEPSARWLLFAISLLLSLQSAFPTQAQDYNYDDPSTWDVYQPGDLAVTTVADPDAEGDSALQITTLVPRDNWWESIVQTFQNQSLTDVAGTTHTITFRYRADEARQIRLSILSRPLDTYGSNDTAYYSDFLQATTEYQTFTYTFTSVATVPSTVYVGFLVGGSEVPIYLDAIIMESETTVPETDGGNFDDLSKWNVYPEGGIELAVANDPQASGGEAIRATVLQVQENWWQAGMQTIQNESVPDEAGKRYTVSFRYRADEDRQVRLSLQSRPLDTYGSNDTQYYNEFLQATTAYQRFTYTFSSVATVPSTIYMLLMMGDNDVPLYFDDINIQEAAIERMTNGTFYVNPVGSDDNSGEANTPEEAWQTITHAVTQLIGGDTLLLADGLYQENNLTVDGINGSPEAYTVIKSINRWGAKVEKTTEYGVVFPILNCSYMEVDGIEVFNNREGSDNKAAGLEIMDSHHTLIKNVYAHDCGCNGISGRESDYMTFERNVLRDNAKKSVYNCSGLSIYQPITIDNEPGYHLIIRDNVAFENECRLPFTPLGFTVPTDGNGIILDDFNQTQSEGVPAFTAATLVENNLSFNNGGAGIKIFEASNITVRNNTAWHNNYVLEEYGSNLGDIGLQQVSGEMNVYNNIIVKAFGQRGHAFFLQGNATATLANNLMVGSTRYENITPTLRDNRIVTEDQQSYPAFAQATENVELTSVDGFKAYFGLRETSPAVDAADATLAPATDLNGVARPVGEGVDIGAYEGPVEGVGPLPTDEVLTAEIESTTLNIVIDGIREGAYTGETYALSKTVVAPTGDLSVAAQWTSLWDEDYWYFYVEVTDNDRRNDSPGSYDDDGVEIYIDADNSRDSTYGANDFHYILGWNDDNVVEAIRGATDGVETAFADTDEGYRLEVAIPWTTLGVSPADTARLGVDVHVNDDDAGGARDSKITWQAQQDEPSPSQFGEAVLQSVAPPPGIASTATAITIDGTAEAAWDDVALYDVANVVKPTVTDSTDLSARWQALWDSTYLYFFVAVADDDLRNDSENWYDDDGIEIYLDADNSKNQDYGSDEYQITIGWNNGDSVIDTKGNLGAGAVASVVDTDRGYNVEVAIPWSAIGATPTPGLFFGLDVHAIDDDEGGSVSGKLAWFTEIDESYRNPSLFGTAYLAGETPSEATGKEIPGKIEAEAYQAQPGVTVAPSGEDDTEAVINLDHGDYLDYEVSVQEAGMYRFTYRVARERNGFVAFSLKSGDDVLHYGKLLKPTAVDEWTEVAAYAYLPAGTQTLRIQSIGQKWRINWFAAEAIDMSLPGKIEAEAFAESQGYVPVLPSGDTDQTAAITFLREGSFVTYPVTIVQAGTYTFTYRVRTVSNKASFLMQLGEQTLHEVKVKRLKRQPFGWQEVTVRAELPVGDHTLRLVSQQTGGSINWWRAEPLGSDNARVADSSQEKQPVASEQSFSVYPNPTQGTVQLLLPTAEPAQVHVYDSQGRTVRTSEYSGARTPTLNLQGLPQGLYMIRVNTGGQALQQRVVLRP